MQKGSTQIKDRSLGLSHLTAMMNAVVIIVLGLGLIGFVNVQMRRYALENARQKARILLDHNFSLHTYFTQRLKPEIFKLTAPIMTDEYFNPVWMSSTFAVREIDSYFRTMNPEKGYFPEDYYYKECAVNARSTQNEADAYEAAFLAKINTAGSGIEAVSAVRRIDGNPFYTVLRRAEIMEDSCLRCHGDPEDAPREMVALYGPERSFHRKTGDVSSAVSIRIPLGSAYASANQISYLLTATLVMVLLLIYATQYLINRHFIFRPMAVIRKQAEKMIASEAAIGVSIALPRGKDLRTLTTAFNAMSRRLRYYMDQLESLVYDRTKKLAAEKEIMATTLESIGDAVIVTDVSGKITLINAEAAALTGWEQAEGMNQPLDRVFTIVNEDTREKVDSPVRRVIETGKIAGLANHTLLINRHGREIPIKDSAAPIVMKNKKCIGAVLVFRDDSADRQMEQVLRQNEQKYRSVFDNAIEGILVAKHDRIAFANTALENMLGYPQEVLRSMAFTEFIHPDDRDMVYENYRKRLSGETVETGYEFRAVTASGEEKWVSISSNALEWEGDRATLNFVSDISERISAEAEKETFRSQLHHAQKMETIGTLAGGIAHDFNNILASILGYSQLALGRVDTGSKVADDLNEIFAAGNRAKDLVKQILTISRHDEKEIRPVQITTLIKEALKMLRSTIPSSIEMKDNISSTPLVVLADPTQIHQVIVNLVTNAKHAMADGTGILEIGVDTVTFETDIKPRHPEMPPGNYVRITVSDNGSGIPKNNLEKIFEPYFTTKAKGEGTGLGLSVVHGIVTSHNGHIAVSSEPGMGT
ncbi:MAG: PAS domain S-box protein, partial [Desulfotignum sp.]|nr:PAS domain S-box protein [Desulfotignum sp.]